MARLVPGLEEHSLEGIVVKRKESMYLEGKEPGSWIKYRLYEIGEFVIGGYLKRDDLFFDALIVGQYEGADLLYKEKVRFRLRGREEASAMERYGVAACAGVPNP